ncbi:MAG: hypothetical protein KBC41_04065 [Candidatus Pacebacteria bacterium]|nr:hypothetical protein [Candidatus Paceibacterota bacterium]
MKISIKSPDQRRPEVVWVEGIDIIEYYHYENVLKQGFEKKITLCVINKHGTKIIKTTPSAFRQSKKSLYHIS